MRRKLTAAIFTVSTLTSGLADALGLGEATVRSSLNQPLNAEIELLSTDGLSEREIITALASREEFLRANVERVYFLSDLRFKVEKSGNKTIIRVTSSRSVREPFLNFLVEVSWPTGRLLREYALLIDPPTFSEEPASPVVQARSTSSAQTSSPSGQGTAQSVARVSTGDPVRQSVSEYGPTERNDTLWSIAMQTRPDSSITPQQMMLAIQRLNPEAFLNGNINLLKEGQVLRIPSQDEALELSFREAVASVGAQNRDFASDSRPTTAAYGQRSQGASDLSGGPVARRDELRIVVDTESEQVRPSAAVSGSTSGGAGDAQAAVAMEELDKVERENEELQSRVGDLEEQLETLQRLLALKNDQLAALQVEAEAVTEEDLTGEAEVLEGTVETGVDEAESALFAGEALAEESTEEAESVLSDHAGAMTEEAMDDAAETVADAADSMAEDLSETTAETAEGAQDVAATVTPEPASTAVETRAAEPSEQNWIEAIKTNPAYQVALGAGGIVLLLILWMLSRNSARRESAYLEKQDNASLANDNAVPEGLNFDDEPNASGAPEVSEGAEDESDPVAEAEVYITYQRWDQASKVLVEALESDPDNREARLKLLEVSGENKDKELFGATAAALLALGVPEVSAEVERLQAQYEPTLEDSLLSLDELESQLMSSGGGDSVSAEASEIAVPSDLPSEAEEDDNLDIDFNLDEIELDDEPAEASDKPVLEDPDDLDLGFDEPALEGSAPALDAAEAEGSSPLEGDPLEEQAVPTDAELDATLEQGLDSDFDLSPEPPAEEESASLESLSDELAALDQDLEDSVDALAEPAPAADEDFSLELDDEDLDLDIDDSDLSEKLASLDEEIGSLENELEAAADSEEGDLSLALDSELSEPVVEGEDASDAESDELESLDAVPEMTAETLEKSMSEEGGDDFVDNLEEDFEFLAGTDEAATKLDLARAYIDMGDKDGAKDILEEVSEEGSDAQKQEAQDLLKDL